MLFFKGTGLLRHPIYIYIYIYLSLSLSLSLSIIVLIPQIFFSSKPSVMQVPASWQATAAVTIIREKGRTHVWNPWEMHKCHVC